MAQTSATITPAFGREYAGKNAALADWREGKDFTLNTLKGTIYCSIRDRQVLIESGITHLTFRNGRGRILVNVPV